jgi:hypothetical protein
VGSMAPLAYGCTIQSWLRCMFLSAHTSDLAPALVRRFARFVSWRRPGNVTVRSSGRRTSLRLCTWAYRPRSLDRSNSGSRPPELSMGAKAMIRRSRLERR